MSIFHIPPFVSRFAGFPFKPFILFLILAVGFSDSVAQDARAIVERADAHLRGESSYGEMSMKIVRPGWDRTITMKTWSRGTQFSMVLITAPARDKGTSFLKRRNEIWNWVPSIGRSVKLPPSMMMQSWMGSDFTNDDLVRESSVVNDYTHSLEGMSEIGGTPVYVIQMIPKPDAPVVWGRVTMYISTEEYLQLRTEFFDEDDELITILEGMDIRTFDGRRLPSRLVMTPVDKPGNQTILEYHQISFRSDIPESFFSIQNMRRLE